MSKSSHLPQVLLKPVAFATMFQWKAGGLLPLMKQYMSD